MHFSKRQLSMRNSKPVRQAASIFSPLVSIGLCGLLLAGCGPKGQDPNARAIPAPSNVPKAPPVKAVPIDAALIDAAKAQITKSLASTDSTAIPRVHALEAVTELGLSEHAPEVMAALTADAPIVRFVGVMAAGGLKLEGAHQQLLSMAQDSNPRVRVAVRYALHRLGDTQLSHDLEKYSRDPDKGVRGSTAMVLGLLNEPTAVRVLNVLAKDPEPTVRQQAYEALWRLGEQSGLDALVGMSVSRYPDDEMFALLALAEPHDQRVGKTLETGLGQDYIEVNLVAARALGMLGTDEGYAIALKGAASSDPRQRVMAALAFGAIGRSDTQDILRKLLADDWESVRISAAKAILQLKAQ
jgi:HEAT repeat protein